MTVGSFSGSSLDPEQDPDSLPRMLDSNTEAVWNVLRAAGPYLQKDAAVVLTAAWSPLIHPAPLGQVAYRASKSAVISIGEGFAEEWAARGIRVNLVAPAVLDTEANRQTMPGQGHRNWVDVSDAARVMAFLLSDAARAVTGAILPLRMG